MGEHVPANSKRVAILDAGSQYSKVIDRRVRDLNIASDIFKFDSPADTLRDYGAIIISGGPASVYSETAPKYDRAIFELGVPVLGICYGMQLINLIFGGTIERRQDREDGEHIIDVDSTSILFRGLDTKQMVLLTHGDSVLDVAQGFRVIARSGAIVAAIENVDKKIYGLQFHPEVDLTTNGQNILRSFLLDIAKLCADFTMEDREQIAINEIRGRVGDKKALVLVSGGVDSAVCAALLSKAIGPERIHALHIDNGFMRKEESHKVENALAVLGLSLQVVDATETFLSATTTIHGKESARLDSTVHPEEKRKIIGDTFMRVAQQAIERLGIRSEDIYLAQGTLRPDLIESSSKSVSHTADVIKTHHNDTDLVRALRDSGRVVEPLRDYHKDEVRVLGKSLGLPEELVWRQPFPGPGLAIRIICADVPYLDEYEPTDAILQFIFTEFCNAKPRERRRNSIELNGETKERVKTLIENLSVREKLSKIDDVRAALVPIQTVGVQGDGRSYNYLVALFGNQDWEHLSLLAKLIPKILHNVNRVVFAFGDPIDSLDITITPTRLSRETIAILQEADEIVNQALLKYNLVRKLSQVPVVLFPVPFGKPGMRSIGIRTFITNDFMTGVPAVPGKDIPIVCLTEMVTAIQKVAGVSRVVYDLTSKPPGTTEWE